MPPQRTLVQSMQNLSLEPASEDPNRESEKAVPSRARQSSGRSKTYRWPKLPEGWHEQDRYFVLGWSLKHPRLQEFVRFTTPEHLEVLPFSLRAPDYLEAASGWPHIHVCSVLPQDANPPEPWSDPNGPREVIIAIALTGSRRLYETKPSKEQYVWFLNLFGCYPQWYRDAFPKKSSICSALWY